MRSVPMEAIGLDSEWREHYIRWCNEFVVCARCGTRYLEIDNLGHYGCRQHVLKFNAHRAGEFYGIGQWDCCGAKPGWRGVKYPDGCVPCDHTTRGAHYVFDKTDDIPIPLMFRQHFPSSPNAIVRPESQGEDQDDAFDPDAGAETRDVVRNYIYIRRFDQSVALSRATTGMTLCTDKRRECDGYRIPIQYRIG